MPFLGLIIALTRKFYFVTLTNTSVIVNLANRFTNRPGEVVVVYSRDHFPMTKAKRARVWSSIYLQFAPEGKPKRLNVHRYWRQELDQLMAAFPATPEVEAPAA